MENPVEPKFEVHLTRSSIVKAESPMPHPHILTLSNLDLLSGRFPVTYIYFYKKPELPTDDFTSIVKSLKTSLASVLNLYYPFAGRIIDDPNTREPKIICDNTGALIVEASANIPLQKFDFYNLDESFTGKLVSVNSEFPLHVQVTHYTCGGVSITFTFDHALGDASSFGKFLLSWSEIARKEAVSCIPDHRRNLRARCPPTHHPSLDQTFVKCTIEEIQNVPNFNTLLKRLYYIDASSIDRLQDLACANGKRKTKIEAFSAYIWKIMVAALDKKHEKCNMGWLIDGRGRLGAGDKNPASNYIGNVLSLGIGEASVRDLKEGTLSDVAENVHEVIAKSTKEDHFLDLIDWIECHRPGLMLSRAVLGQGGPTVVLSSGRRFPVAELDFGFGSPVLGTVYSTVERIGVGYLNQRQSARNDGSWTISAILWPELAAALESDSVFQPMSATHLSF
ncbi:hypothetical protein SLEP1_g21877 [Rubroshorea leprosula]|uniref:Uncharacterized protein n=1 Tax=Rubroshorea leprosula TaxID=152421 RepID=A0AAV5JDF2_9ROSI|nr:hypothetical protein SLEP1_g21877 [Rubroshorea leprosula]